MQCPACGSPLVPAQYQGLLFQRCVACSSTWFASGMIKACVDAMVKTGGIPDAALDVGKKILGSAGASAFRCPACAQAMALMNYGYDSNVIVDHCGSCNGIWAGDVKVRDIAVYTKGNPRMNALGEAFLEESGKMHEDGDKARFLFSMVNPFTWILLPYRTSVPVVLRPFVLTILAVMNVFVFFLEPRRMGPFLRRFGLVPAMVAAGHNYHGFLTSMFLHAGILHLLGNMYFLWLFGRNVESTLDHGEFLLLYMVSGLTAGATQFLLDPASVIPMLGASGAISGVLGAYMRLHPKSKVDVWMGRGRTRTVSARFYLGAWFALQAGALLKNAAFGTSSGVAVAAHIGGFLAGYFLAPVPAEAEAPLQPA